jgi:hypothetical protein
MGNECEYELAVARGLPNNEQIWILFSEKLKRVVATYKDGITTPPPESPEERRKGEATLVYESFLNNRGSNLYSGCYSVLWGLYQLQRDNVDSAAAVSIAIKAAEKCYNSEMTFISARPMGDNKEHWMIYSIPKVVFEEEVSSEKLSMQEYCGFETNRLYNNGFLFMPRVWQDYCPTAIVVIISKEHGQVLFMGNI